MSVDDRTDVALRPGAGLAEYREPVLDLRLASAAEPPVLKPIEVSRSSTAGEALQASLVEAVTRVLEQDHPIRMEGDPEGVHQARVGLRRLRSNLRSFAPLVDDAWCDGLRDEMRWLADALGSVRDLDVLRDGLAAELEELPLARDRAFGEELIGRLAGDRELALAALEEVMESQRYAALLARLVDAAADPLLTRESSRPARKLVPRIVAKPWRRLVRAVEAAGTDPAPAELHAVRIRAKRARYAVEVAAPIVGRPARDLARGLKGLQELLGEHQDTVVAESWLRAAVESSTPGEALVAGQLIGLGRSRAEQLRSELPSTWRRVAREKNVAWLR